MIAVLRHLLASWLLILAMALPGWAQETPDYEIWIGVADRAEQVIDGQRASDAALEVLRARLVAWRSEFQQAQQINSARIETTRAQIDALGPPPEEGATEPADIAAQRTELNARLAEEEAPARRAVAEFQRAQGLIGEIDALIAQRLTGELLSLGPSPLNPANWPEAVEALTGWIGAMVSETERLVASDLRRAELHQNAPLIVVYLLIALVLLARGWRWTGHLMARAIAREETSPGARLSLFFLSLLQVLAPVVGVAAIVAAIEATGFVGLRASALTDQIAAITVFLMVSVWLGRQVFPARETAVRPLNLTTGERRQGRWIAIIFGIALGLGTLIDEIANSGAFTDAARLTLFFPVVIALGLLLFRLGQLLISHVRHETTEDADLSVPNQIIRVVGWSAMILGVSGPILAAIGYYTAGISFLLPTTMSLALLALVRILQRLVTNLYGTLTGRREGLDEALTPTLIGFVLAILSLPLFAMIWGVRAAPLVDLWQQVIQGFSLGGVTISPRNFLVFALVFAAGYTATRLVQATLRSSVLPKTRLDAGGSNAVLSGTGYVGIFLAAVIAITAAGIDLSSLAIVAGALSVGIGFGLQTIVSNFVSGIILLIERPIKQGDWIEVNGVMGYVRDISVRSTRIETFDRSDVIVPNADLISGVVTNMTHHNNTGRAIVPVGVAYGTDTKRVEGILREVAEAHPMVLLNPPPSIFFRGFGADSLDFEIRAILRDVNWVLSVKSDLNHAIAARFAEEGIEIPFAQRDIWLRNPETLRGDATTTASGPPKTPLPNHDPSDFDTDGADGEPET
jgi:small-conductance mechanosensitive channel